MLLSLFLPQQAGVIRGKFGWMRERRLSERALAGTAASAVALDTSMLLEDMLRYLRELFNVCRVEWCAVGDGREHQLLHLVRAEISLIQRVAVFATETP